jgi:hypothetical protein
MNHRFACVLLAVCLLAILASAQNAPPSVPAVDPATPLLNQINDVSCILYSIALYCSAGIAALIIMLAGLEYMGSEDDNAKRNRGKTRAIYAVAGLTLIILACPLVDYLVTNTKILPFQRACDCLGGGVKVTTTTTTIYVTTTTLNGTTTTSGSTTTTTLSSLGKGCVLFDSSVDRFVNAADTSGPAECDNSRYALNVANWLDHGNRKILVYISCTDCYSDAKFQNSLTGALPGFSVDYNGRPNVITKSLLQPYGQVWFLDFANYMTPTLSTAEIDAIDEFQKNGGSVLLSGECLTNEEIMQSMVRDIAPRFGVEMRGNFDTEALCPDQELCIAPSFTSQPISSGVSKIMCTGSDLKITSSNPKVKTLATVNGQPYIMGMDDCGQTPPTTSTTSTTVVTSSSTTIQSTTTSSTTSSTIAPSLTILFIPVDWSGSMASFDSVMDTQANIILSNIPLKTCPAKFKAIKSHTACTANIPADFNTCWSRAQSIFSKIDTCAKATGERYDYVIGFSPDTKCGGRGFSSAGAGIIYLAATSYEFASIHELAHEWDIGDEYYDTCRCFGSSFPNYKYNCLDASIGGTDPYSGFTSSYCGPGGSQCPSFGELSCLGNKNPTNARCIMGYGQRTNNQPFCKHCSAHINSISFLNC